MNDLIYPITDAAFEALRRDIESCDDILLQAKAGSDEAYEVLAGYTALDGDRDDRTAELARLYITRERRLTAARELDAAIRALSDCAPGSAPVTKMRHAVAIIEAHLALRALDS